MSEDNNSKSNKKEMLHQIKIWQSPFWQITFIVIILLFIILILPYILNDRGANIVFTFTSILASVGATYYFSYKSFNSTLLQKQKERAFIAVRRPMEISKGIRLLSKFLEERCKELYGDEKRFPDESGRVVIRHSFQSLIEITRLIHSQALNAIDDWYDVIGDELRVNALFEKEFEDLKADQAEHLATIQKEYENKEISMKDAAAEEKRTLQEKFISDKQEIERQYEKKLANLINSYKSTLPSNVPSGSLPPPFLAPSYSGSGYDQNHSSFDNSISSRPKCPYCGSINFSYNGYSGKKKCSNCLKDY
jgi:hypothetical protein